ncbi:hypothetical protein E2C01_035618 [Portunus trituberculatus]|uniref:Uncharacterized protein n=1 Tax=Portunus trituberculatus TaxID=210409 RepID=A0A5B7F8Y1_PORTR|nr:hypothetical protein [Portunus trituberculatus]
MNLLSLIIRRESLLHATSPLSRRDGAVVWQATTPYLGHLSPRKDKNPNHAGHVGLLRRVQVSQFEPVSPGVNKWGQHNEVLRIDTRLTVKYYPIFNHISSK